MASPAPDVFPIAAIAAASNVADDADHARRPARVSSGALTWLAIVAGIAAIAGSFMLVSTLTSDAPIPDYLGDYRLNDLGGGTNFQIAFVIAGTLMLFGAVTARQGTPDGGGRFGAGLISGAGLALAPFVAFMWASADAVSNRALIQAESVSNAGGGGQFFESELGAGFFVLIGAGVLGLIASVIALTRAVDDGGEPFSTALCVGGAIACLVAAGGQLIPERGFRFADNFSNDFNSSAHVYSRLGMIAVVALGGIFGFLLASRFGLGLMLGAVSLYVWQWLSSMSTAGDYPAPPALGNPGNISARPHLVTTVGVIALVVVACVIGGIASITGRRAQAPDQLVTSMSRPSST